MRLTLRTLLAYMDEMLEPADAAAIREKLDQNEQAASILHRVRDVVRRLRIGAPKVSERGLAGDANNVAEYLDNMMSAAKVADFERACLESDVHLAEVAGSHQILALVLREQAEVEPGMRQQIYELVERVTTPEAHQAEAVAAGALESVPAARGETPAIVAVDEEAAPPTTEPAPLLSTPQRRQREVPEYLREERQSQWWPLVAATVLLGALVGALYFAVAGQSLSDLLGGLTVAEGPDKQDLAKDKPATSAQTKSEAAETSSSTESATDAGSTTAGDAAPSSDAAGSDTTGSEPAGESGTAAPSAPNTDGSDAAPLPANTVPGEPPLPTETPPAEVPAPASPAGAPVELPDETPAEGEPQPSARPAAAPVSVARLMKEEAVLLRFDRAAPGWQRLASGDEIRSDEQLLVLPVFRPVVQLQSGVLLELVGPTDCTLTGPDAEGVPGIQLKYGQVKILAAGHAGSRLRITLAEHEALLTLANDESVAALDLGLFHNPGDDPEQVRPLDVIGVYAVSGQVEMATPGSNEAPQKFVGPKLIVTPSLPSGPVATGLPTWISSETSALIDRRAAKEIGEQLVAESNIVLALKEAADRPQIEVRALAARCLCQISEFDAALRLLADKDAKSFWDGLAMSLIAATCRSPADTQRVAEAFARQFGAAGKQSYRLLWGFSNEQLTAGADAQLIDALESDDLCVRRLAIWNLGQITGATMYYQPEQSPKSRQQAAQKWRTKLKKGEIRYGKAPAAAEEPLPGDA
ncbi:MAG: hypothetical protein K1X74_00890 [Pirellulales bacterium]|nr:hypothetical protein [Pirellulales bacterium]